MWAEHSVTRLQHHFTSVAQYNITTPCYITVALLQLGKGFLFLTLIFLSLLTSLSQYSDDNMMDPYNLAICFGPTLMSVPEGHDQVSCQAHVNELIKTIIIHHETILPGPCELEGPIYDCGGAAEEYW